MPPRMLRIDAEQLAARGFTYDGSDAEGRRQLIVLDPARLAGFYEITSERGTVILRSGDSTQRLESRHRIRYGVDGSNGTL